MLERQGRRRVLGPHPCWCLAVRVLALVLTTAVLYQLRFESLEATRPPPVAWRVTALKEALDPDSAVTSVGSDKLPSWLTHDQVGMA